MKELSADAEVCRLGGGTLTEVLSHGVVQCQRQGH